MKSIIRFIQAKTKMMILQVCEDGNDDAQRMLDQRAATETFDKNRTLLSTITKQQQAMETGPLGYLYTHIHARTQPRTHSRIQSNTKTHIRFIHHSIYPVNTRTDADLNMRTHTHSKRIQLSNVYIFPHIYLHICMFIHTCRC